MLSFGKIMVIVVVAVGALIAFRVFGAVSKSLGRQAPPPERRDEAPRAPRSAELTSCPKCGVYTDTPCGQPDCPLRR